MLMMVCESARVMPRRKRFVALMTTGSKQVNETGCLQLPPHVGRTLFANEPKCSGTNFMFE